MITLQNADIQATIHPKGAELVSLILLASELEFMWQGDPAFWSKHSPVLFPIVGGLKDNTYYCNDKAYHLPRHGFAREKTFAVEQQQSDSVTFLLTHDESTLSVYPFEFAFRVRYALLNNQLQVSYMVENPGSDTLWFSVGAHPAFKVPLLEGTQYNDYVLSFNQSEDWARWPLTPEGMVEKMPVVLVKQATDLPLSKELFYEDALVFKNYRSDSVVLHTPKSPHSLRFDFPGFPYLGIWAAKNADFVCIEPWCGIADSVDHTQDITQKEGIISLATKEHFERTWTVTLG
ncbi:aldose 1-epimerase family protein [Runella slithyformis]|uniref:Aldose 1-epimerase n=1 Tax=Runella slithyformis (strain ATCC 29530 / DSM 19594 / LMG 11500 / NCIMB 11436 / LSU 4) TaxID=761193 RepID=A0A7U3ZQY7_RUNSL|nr:aldose 1-epimerase family protein [Runella slithyformis]AEI51755.1 Aldose 1-epimerase [Runella slithyformis DSM 19594]